MAVSLQSTGGGGGSSCSGVLLTELVPGASLNGRNPASLTIPQLKWWLQCRNATTKGKKADLVAR